MFHKIRGLFGLMVLLGACTSQNGEDLLAGAGPAPAPSCDISHVTYVLSVGPLLQQNCARCHDSALASGGVDLSSYAKVRTLAATGLLLGVVNHDPGFAPMPQGAPKLSDCELAQLRQWVAGGILND